MDNLFDVIGMDFPRTEEQLIAFNNVYQERSCKGDVSKINPLEILNSLKNTSQKVTNIEYHKRTILAAEIVFRLHNEITLGHLKLQKLIYLCQNVLQMELHTNFLRQAMGPYDPQMMRSIDKQLESNKWFKFTKGDFPLYKPLENVGGHKKWFNIYFNNQIEEIEALIEGFRKEKSDQVELIATLYSCWQSAIKAKTIVSDNLLIKMFYDWSPDKAKFTEIRIKNALNWMKTKGLYPKINF